MDIRHLIDLVEAKPSRYANPVPDRISGLTPTPIGKYLFHGTPLINTLCIIRSNVISSGIEWRGEGSRVALSRNYAVAADFGTYGEVPDTPTVLVLDWAKLAANYKIHPYNDTHSDSQELRSNPFSIDGTEEEEAVYGDIKPLSKYLLSVNADVAMLDRFMEDTDTLAYYEDEHGMRPRNVCAMVAKLKASPILNRVKI